MDKTPITLNIQTEIRRKLPELEKIPFRNQRASFVDANYVLEFQSAEIKLLFWGKTVISANKI